MNYKTFVAVFFFSVISICFFYACDNQKNEKQVENSAQKVLVDSLQIKTTYIFGYLKGGNGDFLIVDTIRVFNNNSGSAVKQDAKEETEGIHQIILDGFNITNSVKDSTRLLINNYTEIVFQTFSFDSTGNFKFNEKLSHETFVNLLSSKEMDRFKSIPFKFVIKNGITISIKEIYIP